MSVFIICKKEKILVGKLLRLGLCDMASLKVYGLGINEAAVQLATAKALNFSEDSVKYYDINFNTISPNFYPLECNLIAQMAYITGEYTLFDSTFNSNNNFKNKFISLTSKETYEIIESNFDKILYAEENIIKLNNKISFEDSNNDILNARIAKQKSIIKNTFLETQNLIISSYFSKAFEKITNLEQVENFRRKLYNYKNIIGITDDYYFFNNYYIAMMEKLEAKYNAIEQGTTYVDNKDTRIVVARENKFIAILKAIKNLLFKSGSEYQKI